MLNIKKPKHVLQLSILKAKPFKSTNNSDSISELSNTTNHFSFHAYTTIQILAKINIYNPNLPFTTTL